MKYRIYGSKPYRLVAVHGGPGAPGSVSTLARGLSRFFGCVETFQTKNSISGQLDELRDQILEISNEKVILFGHSWGAWISYLFAHKYPKMTEKIFLIASGAFDSKYVEEMNKRRLEAFSNDEKKEYLSIIEKLKLKNDNSSALLKRLGELASKADNYEIEDIEENKEAMIAINGEQYRSVWNEGARLRSEGYFKKIAPEIFCPIVIIHGSKDPTPIEGVIEPIKESARFLKSYLIDKSGHDPWKEKYGKETFWNIVENEIN